MKKIILVLFAFAALTACKNKKNHIPDQTLLNTKWVLQSLNGNAVDSLSGKELYLFLEEGTNQANGFGGCNRFLGSYEKLDDGGLAFRDIMSTKKGCEMSAVEDKFILLLGKVSRYELKNNVLYLKTEEGEVATFKVPVVE